MAQSTQRYNARLEIERLNDGKYLIQVRIGEDTIERLSYDSRDAFFAALDQFKQQLTDFETQLDSET